jgi:protein-S-isoprenylcysteine O-methyltransferase Ste14
MYSSLLFLGSGIFVKAPSFLELVITLLVIVSLALTANAEEVEDIQYFGETYQVYKNRTKKFVPYLW